jgi:hypothetical protein
MRTRGRYVGLILTTEVVGIEAPGTFREREADPLSGDDIGC